MRGLSFQPFDNSAGSGDVSRRIGLAIVHALVLRLGGDMTVQRDVNGGTTLTVQLPGAA
jgi:signal transduction histidine kinase